MNGARISKAGLNDFQWPGTRGVLAPLYATSRLPTTAKSTQRRQSLPNDAKVYPTTAKSTHDAKVYPTTAKSTQRRQSLPTTPKSHPRRQSHNHSSSNTRRKVTDPPTCPTSRMIWMSMRLRRETPSCSAPTTPIPKAREAQPTCQLKQKTVCHGRQGATSIHCSI
jgi:hypothetical protein